MKKAIYIILFSFVLIACASTDDEEIDPFLEDSGNFTDSRDGKVYKWVRIGEQIWMAENLAFLPSVYPPASGSSSEPRYYVYDYTGSDMAAGKQNENYSKFGVLYNWPAAKVASPPGWHLPTDEEWKQLEMLLDMTQEQVNALGFRGDEHGLLLKATTTWNKNGHGTDSIGFTAFAGGLRGTSEGFFNVGIAGYWWSATENSSQEAWDRALHGGTPKVNRYHMSKEYGFSVRCVKD